MSFDSLYDVVANLPFEIPKGISVKADINGDLFFIRRETDYTFGFGYFGTNYLWQLKLIPDFLSTLFDDVKMKEIYFHKSKENQKKLLENHKKQMENLGYECWFENDLLYVKS